MAVLKKNYLIKKRNILNEIRANNMGLQELRFFSIYLSKINPNKPDTRVVRFPIDDFKAIMELKNRIKIEYMKQITNSLLAKIVNVPTEHGGYTGFQLFKECTVDTDANGEWFVEIDASDKALPLMFEFKEKYFTYELWNALRLKSANQLRMYEILKQYQNIGSRVLSIIELKELLGIDKDDYNDYRDFRRCVVDVCQEALKKSTDISFSYEPYGKRGKGGKILFLKFIIQQNKCYTDQLSLLDFIEQNKQTENDIGINDKQPQDENMIFLAEACENEFSITEIIHFHDLMVERLPFETIRDERECYKYLMRKYNYMKMQNEREPIKHRRAYMESIIGKD